MNIRQNIEAQMESQRFEAAQAAREVEQQVAWANALERAGELAQMARLSEARRVLQIALEGK